MEQYIFFAVELLVFGLLAVVSFVTLLVGDLLKEIFLP